MPFAGLFVVNGSSSSGMFSLSLRLQPGEEKQQSFSEKAKVPLLDSSGAAVGRQETQEGKY